MAQGRINFYRSFKHLSKDILSYLSNTKRDEIIAQLQQVLASTESFSTKLIGSDRQLAIADIIKELKSLSAYEKKHPNLNKPYINRRWLLLMMEFLTHGDWYEASSPSVLFMQSVLSRLKDYDQIHPLPVGRPLESLYETFKPYAKTQIEDYLRAEKAYEEKQRELSSVKRTTTVIKLEIQKSYQPERAPIKLDLNRPDLLKVGKTLGSIFARVEAKPDNSALLKELPFSKVSDLSFLNRDRKPIVKKPLTSTLNLLEELNQKIQCRKDLDEVSNRKISVR